MKKHSFSTIGTEFSVTIWDEVPDIYFANLIEHIEKTCESFDAAYSRFKQDSLVSKLAQREGTIHIDEKYRDLIPMLRIYEKLYKLSDGQINPLVGNTLADYGYDSAYSLQKKDVVRDTDLLSSILTILDDSTIHLAKPALFDLGALGKGYLIDVLYEILFDHKMTRFLIDGSGDIRYYSSKKVPITCGLEHPANEGELFGTIDITHGALCASALKRRSWSEYHHYYNPITKEFPTFIQGTFVTSEKAVHADALASALFFVEPEKLMPLDVPFAYIIVNQDMKIKKSADCTAHFFDAI